MTVAVFFDTAYTSAESPQLLSIGMVSDAAYECYIELDLESAVGQQRIAVSSPFVLRNVLSQWNRDLMSSEVTEDIGFSAATWLHRLAEHLDTDIKLMCGEQIDAILLEGALKAAGPRWSWIEPRLHWSIASFPNGEELVTAAMTQSWAASREGERIGNHHALADARALAAGFKAMIEAHGPRALQS